jgi:hypothetical protein
MVTKKKELVNEQTSPLFRIMWIHNDTEPARRVFDNNISSFHIGHGFILSVAHNKRIQALLFKSIKKIPEFIKKEDWYTRCWMKMGIRLVHRRRLIARQTSYNYFG